MKIEKIYHYLGVNGIIESPVLLEDVYHITKIKLFADDKKILTNGNETKKMVIIPESEVNNWKEINI